MSKKKEKTSTKIEKEKSSEKVESSAPPLSNEELLAIEKDKNLRLFAEFENFR